MNLPKNGSVVVVDDQPNQAIPILKALSKKGISATWYQGTKQDELPDTPVQNIRLAILDLQLVEGDNNGHTIATRLVNVLRHIIGENNGPYILLIWSLKDALYAESLKEEINKKANKLVPSCIVTLNKVNCIRRVENNGYEDLIQDVLKDIEGSFDEGDLSNIGDAIKKNWRIPQDEEYEAVDNAIGIIETAINKELIKAGVFNLLIIWENLIKDAGVSTVANISNIVELDVYWEQNMRDVFRRMGYARVGQNDVTDEELLRASVMTTIQSFIDNIETLIKRIDLPGYISLKGEELIKGSKEEKDFYIRTNLKENKTYYQFYEAESGKMIIENRDLAKMTSKMKKEATTLKDEAKATGKPFSKHGVELEALVSLGEKYISIPPKLNTGLHLEIKPEKDHIPGNIFVIPIEEEKKKEYLKTYFENLTKEQIIKITFIELEVSPICDYAQAKWKKSRLISGIIYPSELQVKSKDHFYQVEPVFYLDEANKKIVFDCHLFKSLDHEKVQEREIKYRLRRELLLDIIAKVSSHINRPGISFVQ